MNAVFIDAYRGDNKIAVWLKDQGNQKIEIEFKPCIYTEESELAGIVLQKLGLGYKRAEKKTYYGGMMPVFEIEVARIGDYERIVRQIEAAGRYRIRLYNADIAPEQMFMFQNNLRPFSLVDVKNGSIAKLDKEVAVALSKIEITLDIKQDYNTEIQRISFDKKTICGDETRILREFAEYFTQKDPDVVLMEDAFSAIPYLAYRLEKRNIKCPFHRWDQREIRKKGGKAFYSYGRVLYRDYAIRLNGRFLIDSKAVVGTECDIESIMELAYLTRTRVQTVASRSFGASFQSSLVCEMVLRDILVPYKEKPVDIPISMASLLKSDRVGITLDPLVGFHKNVAEMDFSSLYPWIIYNYNISAETILSGEEPLQQVPGLDFKISVKRQGIIPAAIKPILDRRMHYKRNPSLVNKTRVQGLKWVLVTSYGYLRFREFKLGMASSHMAIGAFAREILLKSKGLCEDSGYRVLHGIIDSLYIQKEKIDEENVRKLCREIEIETGIPLCYEGIFKWIVFLPSVNDPNRPVPTRYFGVYLNGEIKARGIEVRQAGVPRIVKRYQQEVLERISKLNEFGEIKKAIPALGRLINNYLSILPALSSRVLCSSVRLSKTNYSSNIPQKIAVARLRKKGRRVMPGQKVEFVYSDSGVVLREEYIGRPDIERYKRLFVRALYAVAEPFGYTKKDVEKLLLKERQMRLEEFIVEARAISAINWSSRTKAL